MVGLVGIIVKGTEGEIEPLIVSNAYRHKSIGRQLTQKVVEEAQNMGLRILSVKPVARNIEAIRFFYKQGFQNLGKVELFLDLAGRKWKRGPELFECRFNF